MSGKIEEGVGCLELKQWDEAGCFAGYASIFGVVDNQNDMLEKGAFAVSLADTKNRVRLLWQHKFEEPIGVFTRIQEDERGLYVEGKLLLDVQRAKEAHALLKEGAIGGLSIGYLPVRHRYDAARGVRILEEVALYEVSLVTFPANVQARVHAVKEDRDGSRHPYDFIHCSEAIDHAMNVLLSK